MTLQQLIKMLEMAPQDRRLRLGFKNPHSYRGYYEDLAFEPAVNVTVSEMLVSARSALGKTFTGWKGGEYTMIEWSEVWLADEGSCGETIGPILLALMLKDEVTT